MCMFDLPWVENNSVGRFSFSTLSEPFVNFRPHRSSGPSGTSGTSGPSGTTGTYGPLL